MLQTRAYSSLGYTGGSWGYQKAKITGAPKRDQHQHCGDKRMGLAGLPLAGCQYLTSQKGVVVCCMVLNVDSSSRGREMRAQVRQNYHFLWPSTGMSCIIGVFVCLLACLPAIIFLSFFSFKDVSFTGLDTFVDAVHSCYHPLHHLKMSRWVEGSNEQPSSQFS